MQFGLVSIVTALSAISAASAASVQTRGSCPNPLLCCPELKTPLDPTVDPILQTLGVNATAIIGSVGLECEVYDDSCSTAPKCCTEAFLLGGTVALGCS
ncbi:hydrophobin family protein [Paecilomyces variotii No. 5]|uniref:Hydrophobin n=1 Tax=Byssochlamys spectabilis (strain No. 5 / NBRC 109023) TaxID=1356009 RepID=V5FTA3_BYSSN|nr:hydrophobin family protein [Paecilomyces variotii No. 5]